MNVINIHKNTDNVCKKKVWMFKVVSLLSIWIGWLVDFMVLNATFNNISVTSWQSVFLVEETGVPGENHRPVASH
jgi:hypothetical protein